MASSCAGWPPVADQISAEAPDLSVAPDDFACRCSPESERRCDAIMAWALEFLSTDQGGEVHSGSTTRENLLTAAAYALSWTYRAQITGISADQWSIVTTSTYDAVPDGDGRYQPVSPPAFVTAIQCDTVEDGIAFTLRAYYEQFGKRRRSGAPAID